MELADLLRRLRTERSYSMEGLARAAGVARGTVFNAEGGQPINSSTLMLLLQALHEKSPIPRSDLLAFSRLSQLSERMLLNLYRGTSAEMAEALDRDGEMHALLDDLLAHADREWVRGTLAALRAQIKRDRPPTPKSVTVRHPPVDRGTHTEHTEVDYEVLPPAPLKERKTKARRKEAQ